MNKIVFAIISTLLFATINADCDLYSGSCDFGPNEKVDIKNPIGMKLSAYCDVTISSKDPQDLHVEILAGSVKFNGKSLKTKDSLDDLAQNGDRITLDGISGDIHATFVNKGKTSIHMSCGMGLPVFDEKDFVPNPGFLAPAALPLVVLHGMGDACVNPGMKQITTYLGKQLNTYSVCIPFSESADTFTHSFMSQAEKACTLVKKDAKLANGFNVFGLSHGSLIGRYLVQKCDIAKPVGTLATMGGPHQGVATLPKCFSGIICKLINSLTGMAVYTSFIQNTIGPAGYYKDPKLFPTYQKMSNFLADINNDKETKNPSYKTRMESLNYLVLVQFGKDTMVNPKESEFFGEYAADGTTILKMEDTDAYKNDTLGLVGLNTNKKIMKTTLPGDHLRFELSDLDKYVIPYLK